MHYNESNTFLGLICGIVGGLFKYFLQMHTVFYINVLQAAMTALICGAAGVAGKEGYLFIKVMIKKMRNKNGNTKS